MAKTTMTDGLTPELKEEAEAILDKLGISISAAYELFYRQIVAHRGLPFEARIPNDTTRRALEDARLGKGKKYASVDDLFADV